MGAKSKLQKERAGKWSRKQQLLQARKAKDPMPVLQPMVAPPAPVLPAVPAGVAGPATPRQNALGAAVMNRAVAVGAVATATVRKLGYGIAQSPRKAVQQLAAEDNLMVNVGQMEELVNKNLEICSECGEQQKLSFTNPRGMVVTMKVACDNCGAVSSALQSSPYIQGTKIPEIHRRTVMGMQSIGCGPSDLATLAIYQNSLSINELYFRQHSKQVAKLNEVSLASALRDAREIVRAEYLKLNPLLDPNAVLDIAVSFDGSWQKRGHTSLFGFGAVIDTLTGLVVDFHVMCKYCHNCAITKADMGAESPEFDVWYQGHKKDCPINFEGPSGNMEPHSAKILWERSIAEGNMRYTTMIGDGDSRAHLEVEHVYGASDDDAVVKEECINHVNKRLGTAIRTMLAGLKGTGVTLGGRGHGTLTQDVIKKLQVILQ
jgi:hypothetical protein